MSEKDHRRDMKKFITMWRAGDKKFKDGLSGHWWKSMHSLGMRNLIHKRVDVIYEQLENKPNIEDLFTNKDGALDHLISKTRYYLKNKERNAVEEGIRKSLATVLYDSFLKVHPKINDLFNPRYKTLCESLHLGGILFSIDFS